MINFKVGDIVLDTIYSRVLLIYKIYDREKEAWAKDKIMNYRVLRETTNPAYKHLDWLTDSYGNYYITSTSEIAKNSKILGSSKVGIILYGN